MLKYVLFILSGRGGTYPNRNIHFQPPVCLIINLFWSFTVDRKFWERLSLLTSHFKAEPRFSSHTAFHFSLAFTSSCLLLCAQTRPDIICPVIFRVMLVADSTAETLPSAVLRNVRVKWCKLSDSGKNVKKQNQNPNETCLEQRAFPLLFNSFNCFGRASVHWTVDPYWLGLKIWTLLG